MVKKIEKTQKKKDLKEIFSSFKSKFAKFHLSTWYFSILFFVAIFFTSIWVWWVGFYDPKPSPEVVAKFESSIENFEAMKSSTEAAIELLKERQEKINNSPDFSEQRDFFVDRRDIEVFDSFQNEQKSGAPMQQKIEDSSMVQ